MTRSSSDLPGLRRDYPGTLLGEHEAAADPFAQFDIWFDEIRTRERDPTAMALATATRDGRPSSRMVLLKGADRRGFVFFTNYRSRKGQEIGQTRYASLLFYWASLDRQVRIEGTVSAVSGEESDAYFASRPLQSRWSAQCLRPERGDRQPRGAGGSRCRRARAVRRGRAEARLVGRIPGRALTVRVLAGTPQSPPRSSPLSSDPADGWLIERLAP